MGVITNSQARALVQLPRGNQPQVMHCITEWHLTSRDSAVLVEKYLASGSPKEQQYVLTHPMEVIEQKGSGQEILDILEGMGLSLGMDVDALLRGEKKLEKKIEKLEKSDKKEKEEKE